MHCFIHFKLLASLKKIIFFVSDSGSKSSLVLSHPGDAPVGQSSPSCSIGPVVKPTSKSPALKPTSNLVASRKSSSVVAPTSSSSPIVPSSVSGPTVPPTVSGPTVPTTSTSQIVPPTVSGPTVPPTSPSPIGPSTVSGPSGISTKRRSSDLAVDYIRLSKRNQALEEEKAIDYQMILEQVTIFI